MRPFLISCRIVLSVILLSMTLTANAQTATRLTFCHNAEAETPRAVASLKFAELIKAKSGGRLVIEINPGGEIRENLEMLSSVRTGALDLTIITHGTLASMIPEVAVFGLPYAFSTPKKVWEILDGAIGDELAEKAKAQDIVILGWMDVGVRHVSNNKRPVLKPEDMNGLRIRTSSDKVQMDTMGAFGAIPVPIGFSDLYEALRIGYAAGQDNPLTNFKRKKMHEVQRYLSLTYHSYNIAPFLMSRQAWSKLASDDRRLIKESAQEATELQRKLSAEADEKILDDYRKAGKLHISAPDPAPFKAATQRIWDNWELKPFGAFVKKLRATSD